MARPTKVRRVEGPIVASLFIPAGWTEEAQPAAQVAIEDFEVMRWVDGHAMDLQAAAKRVGVSKSTAGRMLERARRGIALGMERRTPILLDSAEEGGGITLSAEKGEGEDGPGEIGFPLCAVAADEPDLEAPVASVFGRACFFGLFSGSMKDVEWIRNPGALLARDAARIATKFLAEHRVQLIYAGRFGADAVCVIRELAMHPIIVGGLRVEEVIEGSRLRASRKKEISKQ